MLREYHFSHFLSSVFRLVMDLLLSLNWMTATSEQPPTPPLNRLINRKGIVARVIAPKTASTGTWSHFGMSTCFPSSCRPLLSLKMALVRNVTKNRVTSVFNKTLQKRGHLISNGKAIKAVTNQIIKNLELGIFIPIALSFRLIADSCKFFQIVF